MIRLTLQQREQLKIALKHARYCRARGALRSEAGSSKEHLQTPLQIRSTKTSLELLSAQNAFASERHAS
jgi:hypothetical protein